MRWSGGVLKGSCAAFGEEGRGLEEEPRNPIASSWILTPITAPGTEKDAKTGGGGWGEVGDILTLEAVCIQHIHRDQQCDPQIIKYCFIL